MNDEAPAKHDTPSLAGGRYTFEDMHAGRCTFEQVGEPIPPAADDDAVDDDLPLVKDDEVRQQSLPDFSTMSDAEIAQTSVRLLREATVEVFHRIGAADWLYDLARTDPKNFLKMLQRLLPQSIEQNISITSFEVPAAIRSLSIEDLKAMRNTTSLATAAHGAGIMDVEFVEVPR